MKRPKTKKERDDARTERVITAAEVWEQEVVDRGGHIQKPHGGK